MPAADRLTPEERRSLTHGEFWIPERERNVYRRALEALNGAGIAEARRTLPPLEDEG